MLKEDILMKLKQFNEQHKQEGFNLIGLFGSYANNRENENSDIDLLYEVDDNFLERYKGFALASRIIEIEKELSKSFNKRVELTSPSGLDIETKNKILSGGIYA